MSAANGEKTFMKVIDDTVEMMEGCAHSSHQAFFDGPWSKHRSQTLRVGQANTSVVLSHIERCRQTWKKYDHSERQAKAEATREVTASL